MQGGPGSQISVDRCDLAWLSYGMLPTNIWTYLWLDPVETQPVLITAAAPGKLRCADFVRNASGLYHGMYNN